MTNEEILKKAIIKAIKNGYNTDFSTCKEALDVIISTAVGYMLHHNTYYQTIFSHNFAKAFWGEQCTLNYEPIPDWKYCLQEMVLEKAPLKFIEKYL